MRVDGMDIREVPVDHQLSIVFSIRGTRLVMLTSKDVVEQSTRKETQNNTQHVRTFRLSLNRTKCCTSEVSAPDDRNGHDKNMRLLPPIMHRGHIYLERDCFDT